MRNKFMRFMQGRYGADSFSKFLMVIAVICIALQLITKNSVFYILSLSLLIYIYYRMFSKNIPRRYAENQKYAKYFNKVRTIFYRKKNYYAQMKDFHIYKCPNCKQKIRVPKGKGKIAIRCPKCSTEFTKNS